MVEQAQNFIPRFELLLLGTCINKHQTIFSCLATHVFQPAKWSAGHECDWVQHKERYLTLSSSVFDSVKSTRKPDNFSIYMQKYRLIEHFFVIEND